MHEYEVDVVAAKSVTVEANTREEAEERAREMIAAENAGWSIGAVAATTVKDEHGEWLLLGGDDAPSRGDAR